jgi:hypothetical protein
MWRPYSAHKPGTVLRKLESGAVRITWHTSGDMSALCSAHSHIVQMSGSDPTTPQNSSILQPRRWYNGEIWLTNTVILTPRVRHRSEPA